MIANLDIIHEMHKHLSNKYWYTPPAPREGEKPSVWHALALCPRERERKTAKNNDFVVKNGGFATDLNDVC